MRYRPGIQYIPVDIHVDYGITVDQIRLVVLVNSSMEYISVTGAILISLGLLYVVT